MSKIGLVLSGGGARGAYQVGVLLGISEIAKAMGQESPIKIYTGVSAGAINSSFLACNQGTLNEACVYLTDIWKNLESQKVFRSDVASLGRIGFKWIEELSFGALTGTTPGKALLDTSPLRSLIDLHFKPDKLEENIRSGHIESLAVSAVDYKRTSTVTFVQGQDNLQMWSKARRHGETAKINTDHIMASSSIPIIFPPIKVGDRYFGDGCVRNSSPTSAAIHLGAEKLLIIGVRKEELTMDELLATQKPTAPTVARVVNVILDSVMLDGIEYDVERLSRINKFVSNISANCDQKLEFKKIDFCWFSPSKDIGQLAAEKSNRLPRMLRYLLKGLGSLNDASELISYLLFDPEFCSLLVEIGYEDAYQQKANLERFFST
ncbi:MAG TPA: patatin-like phospholipase family protein [Pseudobdellovibrionaceae bacterium]|nr:patatin-like phospholipase family protein [Pseudobdellovibrionaceae bacterium]